MKYQRLLFKCSWWAMGCWGRLCKVSDTSCWHLFKGSVMLITVSTSVPWEKGTGDSQNFSSPSAHFCFWSRQVSLSGRVCTAGLDWVNMKPLPDFQSTCEEWGFLTCADFKSGSSHSALTDLLLSSLAASVGASWQVWTPVEYIWYGWHQPVLV